MSSPFDISFLETRSSSPPYVLDISSPHCHVQTKDLMTLSDSLLQEIISLVVNVSAIGDSPNTSQAPHHILSKVNRQCRTLIYSMPTFWTNISSSMTEHQVESYIRYSGQLCLLVNLSYTQGTNVTTFLCLFRQLCAHAHRWKQLSISIESKHWKNDDNATAIIRGLCFIASDCTTQLPHLQTFQVGICANERYDCIEREEEVASFFKEWPIPVLCSISISGIIPRFDFARCLSRLDITLSTGHIFSLNSLRPLVTLLKNCPSLYSLQLKFIRSSIGANLVEYIHPAFKEKVTIPNLALLTLCYVENSANGQVNQAHQFQYILDSLLLPKLCACKIKFDAEVVCY